jgi:hypothetical protein
MRARRLNLLIFAVLIKAGPLQAQHDPCLRRVIPVSVSDKQGMIIPGLSASNFQANVKGKPVKMLSVDRDDRPVRVMIVLDRSGSMLRDELTWNGYLAAAMSLVSHMPPRSVVGLTAFGDEILGSVPLTADAAGLREEISGLSSVPKILKKRGGGTALWDALVAAASSFDHPQPGDSLYALTDGDDDASRISRESAQRTLANKGIRLFAFSIRTSEDRGERRAIKNLQEMSRSTGGDVVLVSRRLTARSALLTDKSGNTTDEAGWLEFQFRQIYNFYRVEIELPLPMEKAEVWSLKLIGSNKQGIELMYPPDMPACVLAPSTQK